jgi:hypothetical protein
MAKKRLKKRQLVKCCYRDESYGRTKRNDAAMMGKIINHNLRQLGNYALMLPCIYVRITMETNFQAEIIDFVVII